MGPPSACGKSKPISTPPGRKSSCLNHPERGPKKGPSAFLHPGRSLGFGCFPCPTFFDLLLRLTPFQILAGMAPPTNHSPNLGWVWRILNGSKSDPTATTGTPTQADGAYKALVVMGTPPGRKSSCLNHPEGDQKRAPALFCTLGVAPDLVAFHVRDFRLSTATDTFSNSGRDGSPARSQSEPGLGLAELVW